MRILILLTLALSAIACAHAATPRLLGPPVTPADVVDYSCHTDADCSVKNVGNCCGALPTCVNRDSPVFPDRVRAQCAKDHMAGTCGFPVIESCVCSEGHCSNVAQGNTPDSRTRASQR
jgi:hypothetical protein